MGKKEESHTILNVLCLEDVLKDAELINEMLVDAGYQVKMDIVSEKKEYVDFLKGGSYDIILADNTLPRMDAFVALKLALALKPEIPFICVSGTIGEEKAVELLKQGASDYVLKNKLERLIPKIKRALNEHDLEIKVKQAEKELMENHKLLYDAQKLANMGVWNWKADIDCVTWTEALYKIAGLDPKFPAPTYAQHSAIYTPQSWNLLNNAVERAMKSGEHYELELELIRPDGSIRNIIAFGSAKVDDKKQIIGLYGIVQDITEFKKAQEETIRQKEMLQRVIDHIPVMITYFDKNRKILLTNNELERVLGWTNEEWETENIFAKCYPEPEYFKEVLDFMGRGETGWKDCKTTTKYGNLIDTSWTNVSLPDGVSMGIGQDISERKHFENDLIEAKEKAEESDRLKSAFLTNMSHEIRTPMNGILGFTELLKEPNFSSDDQQDFIQTIQINGARMLNTINSIVDVSKIESGLIDIDIKETNLNEKIEFTHKFFKPEVEIKGLQFLFKSSLPAKEAIIKTDNEKVYGILTNLVYQKKNTRSKMLFLLKIKTFN